MLLKPEISVGDILTIVSIAISVIALLISWQKSQELKRKEFADKIRRGSSTVVVKIQRWRELSIRFFEDIQPLITEADIELVRNQKVPDVRDTFWLKISDVRTMTSQRIIDEQVETAYIDLFGFDPRIQTLFTEVISRLRAIDKSIYTQTRYSTQADILSFLPQSGQFTRTELGNKLRNTCDLLCNECQRLMDESIEPFIKEMVRLIEQNDSQIVKRRFKISSATDLYPISLNQLQEMLDEQVNLKLIQIATASITSTLPNGGDLVRDIVARSLPPNVGYSIASTLPKSEISAPIKSLLAVPLSKTDKPIGVISLDSPHHDKVLEELEKYPSLLSGVVASAATALNEGGNQNSPPSSPTNARILNSKENKKVLRKQTLEPFHQKTMSKPKVRKKKK